MQSGFISKNEAKLKLHNEKIKEIFWVVVFVAFTINSAVLEKKMFQNY
jgi:hypothetical protein